MNNEIALNMFGSGCGQISRMEVPDAFATRLKALGLFEGQDVELARGGNPMIIKAAGGRVAVASEIAERIFLRAARA